MISRMLIALILAQLAGAQDQTFYRVREKLEVKDDEIELEDNALFSLIGSYRKAIKALHKKVHKVNVKLQSISSRILEIREFIRPGTTTRMNELLTSAGDRLQRSRQALITWRKLLTRRSTASFPHALISMR